MAQLQGDKTSAGGRLDGTNASAVSASDFALGAGWGDGTPTVSVESGSTDQRGRIVVTSKGTSQAQATATVTLTFTDGAYENAPFAIVQLSDNDHAVTEAQPTAVTTTTTTLEFTAAVLPVANDTYTFTYIVVA